MVNMSDIDYEPFNPFNVGPPNSGKRMEFKIPTAVTYPPPVFAVVPQDKQGYIRRSVSQDSQLAASSHLKIGPSRIGEVSVSRAIKEEMAAAKRQAASLDEEERIDAGGISKMKLASSRSGIDSKSKVSVKTLMPVRTRRQVAPGDDQAKNRSISGSSVSKNGSRVSWGRETKSRSSSPSKRSSIASKRSGTRSQSSTASSKASLARASSKLKPRSSTASTVTLTGKVSKQRSRTDSVKPSSSKIRSKEESRVSLKSRTSKRPSDTVSVRSRTSKTGHKTTETASQRYIKAKATSETLSQHSVQSKTKEASRSASKSKTHPSKVSLKTKVKAAVPKMRSAKALAEDTSLVSRAAAITERLKAGNEDNFRRYSSVIHNHSMRVPEKQFREDRMSFWFQDAVLS